MALTTPFAQNGDKKEIPQNTSDGSVSFDLGFNSLYALPPEEGGLFIDRAQFNQLMFDTTSQVLENKQQIAAQANRINEVNTTLTASINTKANQATTYTKNEVNNLLNAKANSNAVVALTGNQTIAGVKTFSSVPVCATNPTANNQVANKAYVDSVGNTAVKLTGNQTIAGTKTFSSPVVVPNATADTHAVNLAQLNTKANANATVNLTGNQTIAGVKTFSSVPVCATNPTANNQVANKAYVDSKLGKAYITETYTKGASWYRVWSDKWCEQGGQISAITTNLLKAYRDTNYIILQGFIEGTDGCWYVSDKTTSSFKQSVKISGSSHNYSATANYWYACGYIA